MYNYWEIVLQAVGFNNTANLTSEIILSEAVYQIFKNNKLINHYFNYLQNNDQMQLITNEEVLAFHKDSALKYRLSSKRINEMSRIVELFHQQSIDPIVVKGPVLSWLNYGDGAFRLYNDIDLIIPDFENSIDACMKIMKNQKYQQDYGWGIIKPISSDKTIIGESSIHHEVKCCKGLLNFFSIELKKTLSCIPENIINKFGDHLTSIKLSAGDISTYDIYHTFIILCSNVFQNSETRSTIYYNVNFVRDYIDLLIFTDKYKDALDISRLLNLIYKYCLDLRIKRVLNNLYELIDNNDFNRMMDLKCWLKILKENIQDRSNCIYEINDDIFYETSLSGYEIFDWPISIIERMFNHKREICLKMYKQHIYEIQLCEYYNDIMINSYDKNISVLYSFYTNNEKWYLTINPIFVEGLYLSIKFEILSAPDDEEFLFAGFISPLDYKRMEKIKVFDSNAKAIEKMTDTLIHYEIKNDAIVYDISNLILHPFKLYGKFIYRISLVNTFKNEIDQEIGAHSKQYTLS